MLLQRVKREAARNVAKGLLWCNAKTLLRVQVYGVVFGTWHRPARHAACSAVDVPTARNL